MRRHPSKADERLAAVCKSRGLNVSARVIQSMKERGALRPPPSKVEPYPKGTERIVNALIRNGWQRKAKQAIFMTFMDGHPLTPKGIRWALGTPSTLFPPRVPTAGKTEVEIDHMREEQVDRLAEGAVKDRHPMQVALRKVMREQGIDPREAAWDIAQALQGDTPVVEVERFEPTKDKMVRLPAPWVVRLLGINEVTDEWDEDSQGMSIEIREMFRRIGDPNLGLYLEEALSQATEEQMIEARALTREMLGEAPHLASAETLSPIVGAFVFALANVVGTLDWATRGSALMDRGDEGVGTR